MKKLILTASALAVFAASAFASSANDIEVKVPFAFKAGETTLPAGTYYVTTIARGCILLKGDKGGAFVPGDVAYDSATGRLSLTFDHSGDKYVLQAGVK